MLCEKCDNCEALFHLTEISNDIQSELHFCMKCAKNLKINSNWQDNSFSSINNNSLSGESGIACLNCGLTTKELIYDGRPGCPSCYKYFNSVFNSISENNNIRKFSGKKPSNYIEIFNFQDTTPALNKSYIELLDSKVKLEDELKRAIIEERYEEAAILRDKIKEVIESE
jgi:protein arginine kinase activator